MGDYPSTYTNPKTGEEIKIVSQTHWDAIQDCSKNANLKPMDAEKARANQLKSVESRKANKLARERAKEAALIMAQMGKETVIDPMAILQAQLVQAISDEDQERITDIAGQLMPYTHAKRAAVANLNIDADLSGKSEEELQKMLDSLTPTVQIEHTLGDDDE